MAVDVLRACRITRVRAIRGSDQLFRLRWYKCAEGAQALPLYTCFGSSVWEDDRIPFVGCGEVELAEHRGSRLLPTPAGDHFHGDPDWFLDGVPEEVYLNPPLIPRCVEPDCMGLVVRYTDNTQRFEDVDTLSILKNRGIALEPGVGSHEVAWITQPAERFQLGLMSNVQQFSSGETIWYGSHQWNGLTIRGDLSVWQTAVLLDAGYDSEGNPALALFGSDHAGGLELANWTLSLVVGQDGVAEMLWGAGIASGATYAVLRLQRKIGEPEHSRIAIDGEEGVSGTLGDGSEVTGGIVTSLGSGSSSPPSPGVSTWFGYRGP